MILPEQSSTAHARACDYRTLSCSTIASTLTELPVTFLEETANLRFDDESSDISKHQADAGQRGVNAAEPVEMFASRIRALDILWWAIRGQQHLRQTVHKKLKLKIRNREVRKGTTTMRKPKPQRRYSHTMTLRSF